MKEPWKYRSDTECMLGLGDKFYGKDDGKCRISKFSSDKIETYFHRNIG